MPHAILEAIPSGLARAGSDTLAAEVLPLLAACEFLEKNAGQILKRRRLGLRNLPLWLWGLHNEVHRVPFGKILVIGPSNFPLLLPGVQTLQALAAGNVVVWKPGSSGGSVARLFARLLVESGLPAGILRVTEDTVEAGRASLVEGADKIFFTGSLEAGRAVLRAAAETLTPCVVELSGCDAVVVLPSADLDQVVAALAFGMRLNGSATCIAPRRILLVDADPVRRRMFLSLLLTALKRIDGVHLQDDVKRQLIDLVEDACAAGARIEGAFNPLQRPIVLTEVTPNMRLAQSDVSAPVLSIIDVSTYEGVVAAMEACPFALTAAVFGNEREALAIGEKLCVGSLLVNDLIVPTADPRVPFGGRRASGFGVTRGGEGLLEMTAAKVVSVRRGRRRRHYQPPVNGHEELFGATITAGHGGSWHERLGGLKAMISAARKL